MTPSPFTAEGPYSPLEPRRPRTPGPRVIPDSNPFPRIVLVPEGLVVFAVTFTACLPVAGWLTWHWLRRKETR